MGDDQQPVPRGHPHCDEADLKLGMLDVRDRRRHGSPYTVLASSTETLCFRRLRTSFSGAHSSLTFKVYRANERLGDRQTGGWPLGGLGNGNRDGYGGPALWPFDGERGWADFPVTVSSLMLEDRLTNHYGCVVITREEGLIPLQAIVVGLQGHHHGVHSGAWNE